MSGVAAIGVDGALDGFALVGVDVLDAGTDDEILAAWSSLGDDVGLVVLSSRAAEVLVEATHRRPDRLTVVAP